MRLPFPERCSVCRCAAATGCFPNVGFRPAKIANFGLPQSNTAFQSRYMLTTVIPYSAALLSASASGLTLNSRS